MDDLNQLSAVGMRDANDRRVSYTVKAPQDRFDITRVNVEARRDDQVFVAMDDLADSEISCRSITSTDVASESGTQSLLSDFVPSGTAPWLLRRCNRESSGAGAHPS